MKGIIAVDVDDCIIEMRPLWIKYCEDNWGKVRCPIVSYNLCDYWGDKAMDFWSNESLYDNLTPNPQAAKVLDKLNKSGYEIGFVSYTKKGHFASKCKFLNDWFPYRKFIMNTKEKNYVRCDWFIDDNPHNLTNQYNPVRTILLKTDAKHSQINVDYVAETWQDIYYIITDTAKAKE